jgi:hypothetical protein
LVVFALRGKLAAAAGALAAVLIALGLAVVVGPLGFVNNDPARTRLQLWPDALHMVAARPLTGWGEDATGLVFGRFLSADWSPGVTFDRAHSGPLDVAAMQGILGLAALGWVLFILFRGIWRYRFSDSVAVMGAACIGYSVWVAFNFDWAPATGAFWLLAGTAWSGVRAAENGQACVVDVAPSHRAGRSVLALVMAVAAVWFGVMPVLAEVWEFRGRPDLAVMADPLQAQYHWDLGAGYIASGNAQAGVAELQRAADLGETEAGLYVDLGDADARLGDRASARRAYEEALLIDPYFEPARQRLAGLGA